MARRLGSLAGHFKKFHRRALTGGATPIAVCCRRVGGICSAAMFLGAISAGKHEIHEIHQRDWLPADQGLHQVHLAAIKPRLSCPSCILWSLQCNMKVSRRQLPSAAASLLLAAWGIPIGVRAAPASPVLVSPASNAVNVGTSPVLQVNVSDPGGGNLTVRFYGGITSPGPDFTIAALPDSQYYCASARRGLPAMFSAQTDWIVTNRLAWNIAYVAHLGDIVDTGDSLTQWRNATNALYRLENPADDRPSERHSLRRRRGQPRPVAQRGPHRRHHHLLQPVFRGVPLRRQGLLRRLTAPTTTIISTFSAPAAWTSSPSTWSTMPTRIPPCWPGPMRSCRPIPSGGPSS